MFLQLAFFYYQEGLAGFLTWLGPFSDFTEFVAEREFARSSGAPCNRDTLK